MNEQTIPEDFINSMCLTWWHDFGLDASPVSSLAGGMSAGERTFLRGQMRQLYQHHILPAILAERDRCAKVVEAAAEGRDWDAKFDKHEAASLRAQASFVRDIATAIRKPRTP